MKIIVYLKFGSHLYGTNTPSSDQDFKGVYIPDAQDILLGRVKKSIVEGERPKADGERNTKLDVDSQLYSLQYFFELLAKGETGALDMLFAPDDCIEQSNWIWKVIQNNRHRLVSRKAASFLGYCQTQANKYGIKGSRVAAARIAQNFLAGASTRKAHTLSEHEAEIEQMCAVTEHMEILDIPQGEGGTLKHWSVCGRKMQWTSNVFHCLQIMDRLVNEYGQRALQAERDEGVDWKALSHAVRIGHEAIELLNTGVVTFPLPNAMHVLRVKKGKLPYKEVAEEIESLLDQIEAAHEHSSLREDVDRDWIDNFVETTYRREVVSQ